MTAIANLLSTIIAAKLQYITSSIASMYVHTYMYVCSMKLITSWRVQFSVCC